MNFRKIKFSLLCCCLLLISIFSIWKILPELSSRRNASKEDRRIQTIIHSSDDQQFSKESWQKLKQENNDFKGFLLFDSGLIETPIVQGQDNDEYLQKSFEGTYDTQGIPFMDANCSSYSSNITVYGHNVYYDSNAKFSPLENLTDVETFQENRKVFFFLENEIREYETVYVLYITRDEAGEFDYAQSSFALNTVKQRWIDFMQNKSLFNNEQEVSIFDNFLTLQTCRKWNDDEHLLVVCRETERHGY